MSEQERSVPIVRRHPAVAEADEITRDLEDMIARDRRRIAREPEASDRETVRRRRDRSR